MLNGSVRLAAGGKVQGELAPAETPGAVLGDFLHGVTAGAAGGAAQPHCHHPGATGEADPAVTGCALPGAVRISVPTFGSLAADAPGLCWCCSAAGTGVTSAPQKPPRTSHFIKLTS